MPYVPDPYHDGYCRYSLRQVLETSRLDVVAADAPGSRTIQTRGTQPSVVGEAVSATGVWDVLRATGYLASAVHALQSRGEQPEYAPYDRDDDA